MLNKGNPVRVLVPLGAMGFVAWLITDGGHIWYDQHTSLAWIALIVLAVASLLI